MAPTVAARVVRPESVAGSGAGSGRPPRHRRHHQHRHDGHDRRREPGPGGGARPVVRGQQGRIQQARGQGAQCRCRDDDRRRLGRCEGGERARRGSSRAQQRGLLPAGCRQQPGQLDEREEGDRGGEHDRHCRDGSRGGLALPEVRQRGGQVAVRQQRVPADGRVVVQSFADPGQRGAERGHVLGQEAGGVGGHRPAHVGRRGQGGQPRLVDHQHSGRGSVESGDHRRIAEPAGGGGVVRQPGAGDQDLPLLPGCPDEEEVAGGDAEGVGGARLQHARCGVRRFRWCARFRCVGILGRRRPGPLDDSCVLPQLRIRPQDDGSRRSSRVVPGRRTRRTAAPRFATCGTRSCAARRPWR